MALKFHDEYEYMCPGLFGCSLNTVLDKLNKLGKEGWEVIYFNEDQFSCYKALLKRKITVAKV